MISKKKFTNEYINNTLRKFISKKFLLNEDIKISDDDSFFERGIIDSTGVLELVSYIEETFRFTVEDDELIPDNLDSLDKLTIYIKKKNAHVSK
jgi:acyl carrier protein